MVARSTIVALLLAVAASLHANNDPGADRSFSGYAYDLETDQLVYRELHRRQIAAGRDLLHTVYEAPDGSTLAVREVDFAADDLVPSFRIRDPRDGSVEGTRYTDGEVVVFSRASSRASTDEKRLARKGLVVADAGFDRLIVRHWSALMAGRDFKVNFIVPSRLRAIRFVINKQEVGSLAGEPIVRFRMSPANAILRLLLDPIDVTYHRERKILMRYEGMSNVRADDGDPYVVRIDFPLAERDE